MHHQMICKNTTLVLTDQDKKEVKLIVKEMIKPDASKQYTHYEKYKEPFDAFMRQIHEINHIENYRITDTEVPPFIEDDKTLLLDESH